MSQTPVAGSAMKQLGHTVTGWSDLATRLGLATLAALAAFVAVARPVATRPVVRPVDLAAAFRVGATCSGGTRGSPPSAGAEPAQR